MKNKWYRLGSLLLALVLAVNLLPLSVLAEEYQETRTDAGLVTKTFEDADGNTFTEKVLPDATIGRQGTVLCLVMSLTGSHSKLLPTPHRQK